MAETNDTLKIIHQNLLDAGCDQQIIDKCMKFVEQGSYMNMLPVLSKFRAGLLENIHLRQRQLDCLDYLIYKIKKESF